jgi:hypothetical protein
MVNQLSQDYQPWRSETPMPQPITEGRERSILEAVTNELMLCATAWILHHELAHIDREHVGALQSVEEEKDADREATSWVMDQSPPGLATKKRGLGIAIATISIAMFEMFRRRRRTSAPTHPNPAMRIFSALSHPALTAEPVVAQVAAVMLKLILDNAEVQIDATYDEPQDALSHYCQVLQRAIESSGR